MPSNALPHRTLSLPALPHPTSRRRAHLIMPRVMIVVLVASSLASQVCFVTFCFVTFLVLLRLYCYVIES